ncbi:phage tail protein [Lactiplantibacillus plantarum]|uniref:phage tail protein n=1 Tax=Lactiplantibacillus plantarum TaxID=1590 RepID=UPI00214BD989|nr:phage tail protein [Lactiplantibacillus plantarum]
MAESNATQVILTDDGLKIINAQNTADSAASQASNADSAALIAQSTANAAKSAADSNYDYANSEMAVQSTATAKAQSTADNAFGQATTAIDNDKVTSQAVTDLKDGSKLTIADLENGLATKVANSDYASYKVQTASQIAQKVDNGAFSAYQTTTADLIAQKVATSDFSAYQATTAKEISSKVESSDFKTYQTQTADMIASKVSNVDFNNLTISNRNLALGTATAFTMTGNNTVNNAKTIYTTSKTITRGTTITACFDISSTNTTGTFVIQFGGGTWQRVTVNANNPLTTDIKHYSCTLVTTADFSNGLKLRLDNATGTVTVSNFIISESSKEVNWTPAPEDQATQTQITQLSDDINLRVTKGDLIDEINLQAGNTLISSSGQLTLSGKTIYFDTVNPVIIPSANITGTLTGKTINAGTPLNQYGNTSYPLTINPDGLVATTGFNSMDGLRTEMSAGSFVNKYRAVHSSSNQYEAYDGVFSGNEIALNSGFTNGIDTDFKQSVSGNQLTGQVLISPLNGLTLHGDTQQITFNGTSADVTPKGIIITPYGNINPNGTQNIWYVGNGPTMKTASFGIDGSGANNIQFNRSLDIGNFNINTYHTITSSDNRPIHFNRANGSSVDIFAATVNYTSLVKSSLLSVKKDVKKADTAYWAQLVNSIDLATYQYKTDDNTSHLRLSSIVDDVNVTKQWQLPDVFISRNENGKLSGVDDSVLLNATLATVQEQQKEIDQLNGHNMELEARLNKLEAKLNG